METIFISHKVEHPMTKHKNTMKYTVDYFIEKFEAIPENKWLVGSQGLVEPNGKDPHCALGWCKNTDGKYGYAEANNSKEAAALVELFFINGIRSEHTNEIIKERGWNIVNVNNGDNPRFQQKTAKQRILAALYEINNKQYPEIKERIVYVAFDSEAKALTENLATN